MAVGAEVEDVLVNDIELEEVDVAVRVGRVTRRKKMLTWVLPTETACCLTMLTMLMSTMVMWKKCTLTRPRYSERKGMWNRASG